MASDTTVAIGPKGIEDYQKLKVDSAGRLISSSSLQGLYMAGKITIIALSDSEWTELPATALTNRNSISIQNQSGNGNSVLMNYSPNAPAEGIRIEDGGYRALTIGGGIKVYGRMETGVGAVAVEELA